jgi:hypothetical protein
MIFWSDEKGIKRKEKRKQAPDFFNLRIEFFTTTTTTSILNNLFLFLLAALPLHLRHSFSPLFYHQQQHPIRPLHAAQRTLLQLGLHISSQSFPLDLRFLLLTGFFNHTLRFLLSFLQLGCTRPGFSFSLLLLLQ